MKWIDRSVLPDFVNDPSHFIDQHLRLVQNCLYAAFVGTAFYVVKRTYLFKEFKTVSEIPSIFFEKRISISGRMLEANNSGHIFVKHTPTVNLSRFKRKKDVTDVSKGIAVKMIGVQYNEEQRPKIVEELNKLKGKKVGLQLIYHERSNLKPDEQFAHCLVSRPLVFFHFYLNYRFIRKGLAQAGPLPQNTGIVYDRLNERLLKAQNRAKFWKRVPTVPAIWRKKRAKT